MIFIASSGPGHIIQTRKIPEPGVKRVAFAKLVIYVQLNHFKLDLIIRSFLCVRMCSCHHHGPHRLRFAERRAFFALPLLFNFRTQKSGNEMKQWDFYCEMKLLEVWLMWVEGSWVLIINLDENHIMAMGPEWHWTNYFSKGWLGFCRGFFILEFGNVFQIFFFCISDFQPV